MTRMKNRIAITLICSLLTVICIAPSSGWSQTAAPLQQVEKRLAERQAAADAHRKQMESIKDPDKLTTAMQRHFQMTEEIIALMVERRKLTAAQTQGSGATSGSGSSMQGGGMGGAMEHGMGRGMMEKEMGGMQGGGGMEGEMGMMQKEMGGMQGGTGMGRGMMEKEMGGMGGSGMSGQAGSSAQSGPTKSSNDMTQMMQRISEHSAYMETIKDRTQLSKEMLRHQKMLDQMLQLMQ